MNEVSTAGVELRYAPESTAGTRPTSGFVKIANVKSTPDINPDPSLLECTDLSDTEWKRYIPGLRDMGNAFGVGVNLTSAFITAWEAVCTAYETAKAANKRLWFEIMVPGVKSFFFAGAPVALGLDAFEVDNVAADTAKIVPEAVEGWGASTTLASN